MQYEGIRVTRGREGVNCQCIARRWHADVLKLDYGFPQKNMGVNSGATDRILR